MGNPSNGFYQSPSRDDKTAIEFFLREIRGWDAGLRLILAPSDLAGV